VFSVVIPIFNHSAYLRAGVESALASPLVREILLVDDGSADDSAAIARALTRSFPGRVRDLSDAQPVNQGAHVRLNQLCQAATQTWIAILNSDDLCTPGRFETAELVARTTGCDFISGAILIIDEAGTVIGTKRGIQQPEYPSRLTERFPGLLDTADLRLVLCNQNIIATTSNMMFRRELFRRTEGFADLRYSHDWEFALRATMLGRSLWTPNFLTTYRVHRTNTIKELTPHVNGEIARFFYRFLDDNPVLEADAEIRAALETNAHLQPYVPAPVRPVRPEPGAGVLKSAAMSRRATLNALLCLSQFNYDYVLVSHGLEEAPHHSWCSSAIFWTYRSKGFRCRRVGVLFACPGRAPTRVHPNIGRAAARCRMTLLAKGRTLFQAGRMCCRRASICGRHLHWQRWWRLPTTVGGVWCCRYLWRWAGSSGTPLR